MKIKVASLKEYGEKFGYNEDKDNNCLIDVLANDNRLKEVSVDIYTANPFERSSIFMLPLRCIEKNIIVINDGIRLILKRNDIFGNYIMNILFNKIEESIYQQLSENTYDFILKFQNLYYKLSIIK